MEVRRWLVVVGAAGCHVVGGGAVASVGVLITDLNTCWCCGDLWLCPARPRVLHCLLGLRHPVAVRAGCLHGQLSS